MHSKPESLSLFDDVLVWSLLSEVGGILLFPVEVFSVDDIKSKRSGKKKAKNLCKKMIMETWEDNSTCRVKKN